MTHKRFNKVYTSLLTLLILLSVFMCSCSESGFEISTNDTSDSAYYTEPISADTILETFENETVENIETNVEDTEVEIISETDIDDSSEPLSETLSEFNTTEEPSSDNITSEKVTFEEQEPDTDPANTGEAITLPNELDFDPSSVVKASMPRLDVTTDNGQMITGSNTDKPLYHSTVSISSDNEKYNISNVGATLHVRGNSTAGAAKKPYALKFDEKQSVLGLNNGKAYKSWVLLADYFDETMLRNWMAFRLGDVLLENKWYSADATHVELYINGKYQGVYTLCEKTQINDGRIDIDEKEKDDQSTLQTGYLLIGQGGIWWEENYFDIPIGFTVKDRNGAEMKYGAIRFVLSDGDEYSQAQRDYISKYCSAVFQVIEKALYHNEYYQVTKAGELHKNTKLQKDTTKTDTEKQIETIGAVLDLNSAARMCVLDEIAKNLDAMTFNISVDLSPEGNGKLTLEAPWDFDHAMAKTHYSSTHSTRGWYATALSSSDGVRVNFLTVMLGGTDWFNEMCSEIWKSHYDAIRASVTALLIENYRYEDAFERDWEKWGHPSNRAQTGHHTPQDLASFTTHTDSAVFLAEWFNDRITWLNIQWGDGTPEDMPIPDESLLKVDFTNESCLKYICSFNDCEYVLTENGIELTCTGGDPYFTVDFSWIDNVYEAEDFPYALIYCKADKNNSSSGMYFEYHLCAGKYTSATSGVKCGFNLDDAPGVMRRYEINLCDTPYWQGTIHSLRVDIFSGCQLGDKMIIKRIELNRTKKT